MFLPRLYFIYENIFVYNEDGTVRYPSSNAGELHLPEFVPKDSEVKSKLEKYGIKTPFILTTQTKPEVSEILNSLALTKADRFIDNSNKNIVTLTYEQAINTPDLNVILPIVLYSDDYFYNQAPFRLPNLLNIKISEKKLKVMFLIPTEGWFSRSNLQLSWLYNFGKINNLTSSQLVVVNSNFKSNDNYREFLSLTSYTDFLTIYEFDYFRNSLWFCGDINMIDPNSKIKVQKIFDENLELKFNTNYTKHFLCLNRAVRAHRVFIFSEIASNPVLRDKTDLSMNSADPSKIMYKEVIERDIKPDYKHSRQRLLDFLSTYDQTKPLVFDIKDISSINMADRLNLNAHLTTFVNIVTETFHENNGLFFTEKIYKPMIAAQPFVLVSSPYMLKKLHQFGFKTFSEFWDESYDLEEDYTRRMEKIVDTLEFIASWSLEECKKHYYDMVPILRHNINILKDTADIENIHKNLAIFPNPIL